ncbi:hypothetical protein Droror1_Dr00009762 [Drosera rotundifolia]
MEAAGGFAEETTKRRYSASAIAYLALLSVISVIVVVRLSGTIGRFDVKPINFTRQIASDPKIQARTRRQQSDVIRRDPHKQHHRAPPLHLTSPPQPLITCDRSHYHNDICSITGPTLLDPTNSTLYPVGPAQSPEPITEQIKPYPRKWEPFTMARIRPITLTSSPGPSRCHVTHKAPALVFSAGGYTGNFFHDFNDGFIPLFVTIHTILPSSGRDFVLVVDSAKEWWLRKYADLLRALSKHPVVTLGNNNGSSLHCFESASVGLVSHGFMTIEPNRFPHGPVSLLSFRALLDRAYSPKAQSNQPNLGSISRGALYRRRPRLVLASRSGDVGRVMLNQDRVKALAEDAGFEVVIFEAKAMDPLKHSYQLLNTSHAIVGVHGAALTHMLFMRPGAVFIQVVPVGAGWVAEACFGKAAREMGLDLKRFKGYLKKAYGKAKRFMDNSGE